LSEPSPYAATAASTATKPVAASPSPRAPAPLVRRLAALVYESLLLGAVLLLAGFLSALPFTPAGDSAIRPLQVPALPMRMLTLAVAFGAAALYFGWCWTGGRRTLPMKTWRMRLVRADGRAVDLRTVALRYAAAWIGPALAVAAYAALAPTGHPRLAPWLLLFNYAWAFVDRDRRFLHDRIAGTRIVDERPPQRGPPCP
jgi:uncharacterized RDD family membrane protein YckC